MSIISSKQIWTIINEKSNVPKSVTVRGWVKTNRDSNTFGFISFNDGTDFRNIQLVYKKEITKNFEDFINANTGAAIEATGEIILTPDNLKQPFEILVTNAKLLAQADIDFPLQKKRHTVEYLREIAHLRPRTNLFSAAMRIRSNLYKLLNDYFIENDFVWVSSPELTSTDAEGNGEAFDLGLVNKEHFFGTKTSLSGTGQLHAEAYAMAFNKVFTFSPQFRAEKSHTNRHVAEFWMLEPEVSFMDLDALMYLMEDMLVNVTEKYLKTCPNEIEFLNSFVDTTLSQRLSKILTGKFVHISYTEVIDILLDITKKGHKFENNKIVWGMDLDSEHERYICESHFNGPVFVYNYPIELKAFYMKQNDDCKTVAGVDLLVPGVGELCGGSQREDDYQKIIDRANTMNLPIDGMKWYIDLRKYGYYKSAGFGLGFERLIMYLTGINNIRDVIPFPRAHGNIKF